jgi:excisionase family DNA binding protein
MIDMSRLLNKKEVCNILGISRGSLDNMMKENEIKYIKFERSVRFKKEDIDSLINSKIIG